MATSNGPTGLVTELATSTPLLNFHSNFRGSGVITANAGVSFRIDTRTGVVPHQWFYRSAGSSTENLIMSLNSTGTLYVETLILNTTAQQTNVPRQVLIGSNGVVSQWGQLESYTFRCGGAGFGWGSNCWMNVALGQSNTAGGLTSDYMIKTAGNSRISVSGTFSGYLGSSLMGCGIYFYNVTTPQYFFVGNFYQYQNIGGNHACGGAHGLIQGLPAGSYLMHLNNAGTSISTDANDYCSFSVIIHP